MAQESMFFVVDDVQDLDFRRRIYEFYRWFQGLSDDQRNEIITETRDYLAGQEKALEFLEELYKAASRAESEY